jgi:uncharacterized protein
MNILITGGTGFLGQQLCRVLLHENHQLTILSRKPDVVFSRYQAKVRAISRLADLTREDYFDIVINLAGEGIADKPWTNQRKRLLYNSRVTLTEELVDWMKRANKPPKAFISSSAVGWYGNQQEQILDEDSPAHDEYTHRLCQEWEDAALAARSLKVRVCIIRTGVVLGLQGGMLKRILPVFALNLGGRLGDGQQWLSWISLYDYLSAVLFLMTHPNLQGVFNLTAPQPITNQEFTNTLAVQIDRKAILPVPRALLALLMGEMSTLLVDGQRVLPSRLLKAGFRFRTPSLAEALAYEIKT